MMEGIAPRFRGLASWMAAGVCASVALLTWFGYHAIREWQRSSTLLVERRADAAADLLVTALTRDMHAVQKSVLASPDWDAFMIDPPSDVGNIASAFALSYRVVLRRAEHRGCQRDVLHALEPAAGVGAGPGDPNRFGHHQHRAGGRRGDRRAHRRRCRVRPAVLDLPAPDLRRAIR